jgi:predicted nucleic acid-binding protein
VLSFFDTNVLVYCTDTAAPQKQARARALVAAAAAAGEAVTSTQVLIELFHTLTRKQKMPADIAEALVQAYSAWPAIGSDASLVGAAIGRSVRHRWSIWDAMVIEAASRSGARTLYTEDLQHGLQIGTMTVVDPFLSEADID